MNIQHAKRAHVKQDSDDEEGAASVSASTGNAASSRVLHLPDEHAVPVEEATGYYNGLASRPYFIYQTGTRIPGVEIKFGSSDLHSAIRLGHTGKTVSIRKSSRSWKPTK